MEQTSVKKQAWWQLLSIQAAGMTCLPVIMSGQFVCQKYGWSAALLGVGVGNLFLLIIGYLFASLSTYRRQSTVMHAINYFGNQGKLLFSSLMIVSMMGWFGIQLNIMSLSCQQLLNTIPVSFLNIGIGILICGLMCFGMKAMKGVSYISAPLLGITLLYAVFSAKGSIPLAAPLTISWLGGLSLIVGVNIGVVVDLPTFLRHAKSCRDARICIVVLYALIVPFIEIVGIYLSAITGGSSILEVLQAGHGTLWMMWINCFILLSGWVANNANLYSAWASSHSLFAKLSPIMRMLLLGLVGIVIASFNPLGNIENVLDVLGISIGSMGAVVLGSYLLEQSRPKYTTISWVSIVSCLMGITSGMASVLSYCSITGVSIFDAFIVSLLVQLILRAIYRKDVYETVNS